MMSAESAKSGFPLVDAYLGARMGIDLGALVPGRTAVAESAFRLRREKGYGYLCALWWAWFCDGRSAISVPPGTGKAVEEIVRDVSVPGQLRKADLAERLKVLIDVTLADAGLRPTDRVLPEFSLACNTQRLRQHACGRCCRLVDESVPPAAGIELPTHCFPDGVAYGIIADDKVVSVAFSHRHGVMEDRIADPGVETAVAYRRRGYAKTVVSAVVAHFTRGGGQAIYSCRRDNRASVATARSVGFVPYVIGGLKLSAPEPADRHP